MTAYYYIYFNLHKKCWSVKYRGKVIHHCTSLVAHQCKFIVSEKGRQRVLREQRKNVHAYVRCVSVVMDGVDIGELQIIPISYNPYKHPYFYYTDSEVPCSEVVPTLFLNSDKLIYLPTETSVNKDQ